MTQMTTADFDSLKGHANRFVHSYKKMKELTPGDVILQKRADTFKMEYRRVTAVGRGMVAFNDGAIEPAADDLVIEVQVTGPVTR
jgi:hypothetical protein